MQGLNGVGNGAGWFNRGTTSRRAAELVAVGALSFAATYCLVKAFRIWAGSNLTGQARSTAERVHHLVVAPDEVPALRTALISKCPEVADQLAALTDQQFVQFAQAHESIARLVSPTNASELTLVWRLKEDIAHIPFGLDDEVAAVFIDLMKARDLRVASPELNAHKFLAKMAEARRTMPDFDEKLRKSILDSGESSGLLADEKLCRELLDLSAAEFVPVWEAAMCEVRSAKFEGLMRLLKAAGPDSLGWKAEDWNVWGAAVMADEGHPLRSVVHALTDSSHLKGSWLQEKGLEPVLTLAESDGFIKKTIERSPSSWASVVGRLNLEMLHNEILCEAAKQRILPQHEELSSRLATYLIQRHGWSGS